MVRTTYFVAPNSEIFSTFTVSEKNSQNGLLVQGLSAAKHRKVKNSQDPPRGIINVSIEFCRGSRTIHMLPFDPPTRKGLFVYASLDSDPQSVLDLLDTEGFHFDRKMYHYLKTDDYYYWFVPIGAIQTSADADSLRLAVSSQRVYEEWYHYQSWNEFVEQDGEIGIFTIENRENAMVLSGRVRPNDRNDTQNSRSSDGTTLTAETFGEPMLLRWYPKHQITSESPLAPANIVEPYGLHPSLELSIIAPKPQSLSICRLYVQIDLPSDLFFDKYELQDIIRSNPSANLVALWGDNDLEKPRWHVEQPVSALFRLYNESGAYKFPMHFRYQYPSDMQQTNGTIMSPYVFWACKNDELPVRTENFIEPWEYLGTESAFPLENTQFFVIPSNSVQFRIPTIGISSEKPTELITICVVVLGFFSVLFSVVHKVYYAKSTNCKVKTD